MEVSKEVWTAIPHGGRIDEPARIYAAGMMHQTPYAHYRARLAEMYLSGARMLDAGCGTGTWSFAAANFFFAG